MAIAYDRVTKGMTVLEAAQGTKHQINVLSSLGQTADCEQSWNLVQCWPPLNAKEMCSDADESHRRTTPTLRNALKKYALCVLAVSDDIPRVRERTSNQPGRLELEPW